MSKYSLTKNWSEYYQLGEGRELRAHLQRALELWGERPNPKVALDLGCGQGIESLYLLELGFQVLAWDGDADGLRRLQEKLSADQKQALQVLQTSFESIRSFPQVDLLYSYHSLPFCSAERLSSLLRLLPQALKANGLLAITLFGPKDEWVVGGTAAGVTEQEWREAFASLEILSFRELQKKGPTLKGDEKFWHVFEIIAYKPVNKQYG